MALEKTISYDHGITEAGHIQVRQITRILEDGVEISKTYHRHVTSPGENTDDQDERTKKLAFVLHDKECIDSYNAIIADNKKLGG